jgi:hypothetical protein
MALGVGVLLSGDVTEGFGLFAAVAPAAACHTNIVVVDEAGVEPWQMRVMIEQVERIWTPAGVDFSWGSGPTAESALTVIIQEGTLKKGGAPLAAWRHVLGSIPVSDGHVLSRISVSLGTVRSLLGDALIRGRPLSQRPLRLRQEVEAQVLGRVLAHEIGHYRLRSPGHTPTGLMRAVFTTEELVNREISRFLVESAPAGGAHGGVRPPGLRTLGSDLVSCSLSCS